MTGASHGRLITLTGLLAGLAFRFIALRRLAALL